MRSHTVCHQSGGTFSAQPYKESGAIAKILIFKIFATTMINRNELFPYKLYVKELETELAVAENTIQEAE